MHAARAKNQGCHAWSTKLGGSALMPSDSSTCQPLASRLCKRDTRLRPQHTSTRDSFLEKTQHNPKHLQARQRHVESRGPSASILTASEPGTADLGPHPHRIMRGRSKEPMCLLLIIANFLRPCWLPICAAAGRSHSCGKSSSASSWRW